MHSAEKILALNPQTLQLGGAHGWIDITDPECQLLHAFASSDHQRLEIARMLDLVGKAGLAGKRALEVQIVRLRKKLELAGAAKPTIKSIRKLGYQLCVPIDISHFS